MRASLSLAFVALWAFAAAQGNSTDTPQGNSTGIAPTVPAPVTSQPAGGSNSTNSTESARRDITAPVPILETRQAGTNGTAIAPPRVPVPVVPVPGGGSNSNSTQPARRQASSNTNGTGIAPPKVPVPGVPVPGGGSNSNTNDTAVAPKMPVPVVPAGGYNSNSGDSVRRRAGFGRRQLVTSAVLSQPTAPAVAPSSAVTSAARAAVITASVPAGDDSQPISSGQQPVTTITTSALPTSIGLMERQATAVQPPAGSAAPIAPGAGSSAVAPPVVPSAPVAAAPAQSSAAVIGAPAPEVPLLPPAGSAVARSFEVVRRQTIRVGATRGPLVSPTAAGSPSDAVTNLVSATGSAGPVVPTLA